MAKGTQGSACEMTVIERKNGLVRTSISYDGTNHVLNSGSNAKESGHSN